MIPGKMKRGTIFSILSGLVLVSLLAGVTGCTAQGAEALPPQERLRVATTTSLYDTGLWEYLESIFEREYGVEVYVLSAGTGIALEYGRRGDVDVITVHSKALEEQFIAEGYGVERVPFAYNYFLIVGPANDSAGIRGLSPEDALKKLFETASSSFVSRGDDSGTHNREKAIWKQAGYDYETVREAEQWYVEAGIGMGPALLMASEKQAYTLTDMGTFLSYKNKLDLVPMVDNGNALLNVYSAIAINPVKHPEINIDTANNLISFLISSEIQELIGNYGVGKYGMQLFIPCAGAEPKS